VFHLPCLICAVAMLVDPPIERAPMTGALERAMVLFGESTAVYRDGTLTKVLSYNVWSGHEQKWLWMIGTTRLIQIVGIFFMTVGILILAYFRLDAKKALNRLAPMGRMSVTNYMTQSLIGALLVYNYGFGLAEKLGPSCSIGVGVAFVALQILWSQWWMKRYYYGPVEWLWRSLTWARSKMYLSEES
jgi:uncharacterized membrane protein YeiB